MNGSSGAVAVVEAGPAVAVSFKELQRYARMKLVEERQLLAEEVADVSKLLTVMWHLLVEYSGLTEADLVRAVLKPVLDPFEQRKRECGCFSCKAKKEDKW